MRISKEATRQIAIKMTEKKQKEIDSVRKEISDFGYQLAKSTISENRTHAYCTGLQNGLNRRGIKSNFNKLSESQVLEIRSIYVSKKITQKELAKIFNVTQSCINSIITKKNWAYL